MSSILRRQLQHVDLQVNRDRLKGYQRLVFMFTFTNYAFAHLTRKAHTTVKEFLFKQGISEITLTLSESGFLFTYAFGSVVSGILNDRFSPVGLVSLGLIGSSLCLFCLIIAVCSPHVAKDVLSPVLLVLQLVHGAFQSTGGPSNTAIMAEWFPAKTTEFHGMIYGTWSAHQYLGDASAVLLTAAVLQMQLDWRLCLLIPCITNFFWALLCISFLPNNPEEVGIVASRSLSTNESSEDEGDPSPTNQWRLLDILYKEHMINYTLAFSCLKTISYAMFFHLPSLLRNSSYGGYLNVSYSLGMTLGGVACGFLIDLLGNRHATVISLFILMLIPLIFIFALKTDELPFTTNSVVFALMGALIAGPNNILTSAVATTLGESFTHGEKTSVGTVVGIINGVGSIFAAIGQLLIPILYEIGKKSGVSYKYVWFLLIANCCAGVMLLSPKVYQEIFTGVRLRRLNTTMHATETLSDAQHLPHVEKSYIPYSSLQSYETFSADA